MCLDLNARTLESKNGMAHQYLARKLRALLVGWHSRACRTWLHMLDSRASSHHHASTVGTRRAGVSWVHAQHVQHVPAWGPQGRAWAPIPRANSGRSDCIYTWSMAIVHAQAGKLAQ